MNDKTLQENVTENVRRALLEDVGPGDISAELIDPQANASARVITRSPGIFCGKPWVEETIKQVDANVRLDWHVEDGDAISANMPLFDLSGAARSLLTAERTMLNFVQLLSGTATRTADYVALIRDTDTTLLDTRKTLPGLRIAQKYAVSCGGGQNHRIGLFDAFLLKENHISAAGSITNAVARARALHPNRDVEVEVESIHELKEAIAAGADIAMIDNFTLEETKEAVDLAKGEIKLEASGGINANSITDIASTGVDYISIGDLTKTVTPLDLSMRFKD